MGEAKSDRTLFQAAVEAGSAGERERAIEAVVAEMSLEEKVAQMSGSATLLDFLIMIFRYNYTTYNAGENHRLGVPPIRFTDGPRGVALNHSTCFPVSMARGASFDPELEERIGDAIGVEARSQGADYFGGVCINLVRHPGWGRAQETFGEDTYLLGVMGEALVKGVQRHMMACAKHYACNSIEEARFFVDVKADERTLREVYLPHFKRTVDAGVASFCGHNEVLLKKILKDEWGFDGFVISDFMLGVRSAAAARAGLDIEMPFTWRFGKRLLKAVNSGKVPESDVDEAVTRILRKKAEFAKVGEPDRYGEDKVVCDEHVALALESARKSITLLKNEGGALPLDRSEIKTLLVLGELAELANIGDKGSSQVYPPRVVNPYQGIKELAGPDVKVILNHGRDLSRVRALAKEADAVVVVAGLKAKDEGEHIPVLNIGGDRQDLDLPRRQQALIKAAASENDRVAVVLEGGSAITMEGWRDKVSAILMAWYPGMEGGRAIAEILFGDVNPSGKLPITFPKSTDQLPFFDKKAKQIEYGYYHGYRLFDKKEREPAFAFGYGLSYTEFSYDNLRLEKSEVAPGGKVVASVDVTNSGEMAGNEVVQLYVGYNGSAVDRQVKELKGFTRISLAPGETKTVSIEIPVDDLAYYSEDKASWVVEEIEHLVYMGPSSRESELQSASFHVTGNADVN